MGLVQSTCSRLHSEHNGIKSTFNVNNNNFFGNFTELQWLRFLAHDLILSNL